MLPVFFDLKECVKTSCAFIKLKPKEFQKPFSFVFFFLRIPINEKEEITAISMMTIMTMISSHDRPRSHSGLLLSEETTVQSQCTVYLPVQLTPFQKYPGSLQIHRKDPWVLWHTRLPLQLCFSVAHSLTSTKQEVLLFSLSFF